MSSDGNNFPNQASLALPDINQSRGGSQFSREDMIS